jgi:NAD(P)-dependent dehydrogenase (short-subunit alcohol dehydrogenase family)
MGDPDSAHVLVTGASQGIGKAIAAKLASAHRFVLCVSRSKPDFQGSEGSDCADRITWNPLDLSNATAVEEYAASLEPVAINTLILSAVDYGEGGRHPASEISASEWQRVVATNLVGQCILVSHLLSKLIRNEHSIIINVSSDVAVLPSAGRAAYAASKAGLHAMLRASAAERESDGLRIYQLIPTFQSVTEGIRRRRPAGFDFFSYADPTLIADSVGQIVSPARNPLPPGTYLIHRDGRLTPYAEPISL